MSNYIRGQNGQLYDPVTKQVVGSVGIDGLEYLLTPPSALAKAVTIGPLLPSNGRARTAYAASKAGSAAMRILSVSDSTGMGNGSDATQNLWRPNGPGKLIPASMNAIGLATAPFQNWFGEGNTTGALYTQDARITTTGTINAAGPSIGGYGGSGAAGPTMTFTPGGTFDTVELHHIISPSLGVTAITSPLGSHGSINMNGVLAVAKTTISLGAPTTSITLTASGNFVWQGMDCYTLADKRIRFLNGGWGGSTASNWADTSNVYGPPGMIAALAPDLCIINLGINDWYTPTVIGTFTAALLSIAQACVSAGADIMFQTPFCTAVSVKAETVQRPYVDATFSVASKMGAPVLDVRKVTGSYEGMAGVGGAMGGGDLIHPGLQTYRDIQAPYTAAALQLLLT